MGGKKFNQTNTSRDIKMGLGGENKTSGDLERRV